MAPGGDRRRPRWRTPNRAAHLTELRAAVMALEWACDEDTIPRCPQRSRPPRHPAARRAGWRPRGPGRRAGPVRRRLRARHRRHAPGPRAGRLADVAPHPRRLGLQPPRPDRPRQRRRPAHGVDPRPHRGAAAGHAARLRRRPLHAEPRRRHPGHRRGHRRPRLGAPPRGARRHRRLRLQHPLGEQPEHRHLRLDHPRHQRRRPHLRPRRRDRPDGVGDAGARLPDPSRDPELGAHRRRRQGRLGPELHARRRARRLRHHRPRPPHRRGAVAPGAPSPRRASPATRPGAGCRSRSGGTSGRGWCRATTPR